MNHILLTALLAACHSGEQNFGDSKPSDSTSGGDGRIEVYPADGVACAEITDSASVTCGFRVSSVGEYDLRVISMQIINAGENAGQPVFDNLRPADDSLNFPISIVSGESAEFILRAAMSETGSATGSIELLTNDGSVNDPSPGKIRVPVSASANIRNGSDTGVGGEGDDTGASTDTGESGGDSGSTDPSDAPVGDTGA